VIGDELVTGRAEVIGAACDSTIGAGVDSTADSSTASSADSVFLAGAFFAAAFFAGAFFATAFFAAFFTGCSSQFFSVQPSSRPSLPALALQVEHHVSTHRVQHERERDRLVAQSWLMIGF